MISLDLVASIIGLVFLLILTITDLRAGLLPDRLNLALGLTGIAFHALADPSAPHLAPYLLAGLLGAGALYALCLAFLATTGLEALGLGDVKFAAAAGIWVGALALPTLFFLAAATTLAALPIRDHLARRRGDPPPDRRIPFGPGLAHGVARNRTRFRRRNAAAPR